MNTVTCMKFICFVLILKLNASQVLCKLDFFVKSYHILIRPLERYHDILKISLLYLLGSDEERIHLKESPDTANDINNVNG